jgi:hypothetical protein
MLNDQTNIAIFCGLLLGHAVCDFPLQGDFLARGKNHEAPIPGVPWWICLAAHALIHGGAVALVTGSLPLGGAEFVVHMAVDYGKCAGWFDFKTDQLLHVICKAVWAMLAV